MIPVDLESDSLTADLLDCIAGFPLFVDAMRNAEDGAEISMRLVDELLRRFSEADETRLDLSLVGSAAPDLLYIQIMGLICFDDWTLRYTRFAPRVLFDELRKRGVCSFYILDNAIRDDRFRALVEIFREAGFAVHSPNASVVSKK